MARFRSSFLRAELECSRLSLHEQHSSISIISVSLDVSGIGIHV
jgi:hypothetical protein